MFETLVSNRVRIELTCFHAPLQTAVVLEAVPYILSALSQR